MKKQRFIILVVLVFTLLSCQPLTVEIPTRTIQPTTETPSPAGTNTQTPSKTPRPTPTSEPTPQSDWEDRSLYQSGLVPAARGVLQEDPGASVYHITLDIPAELPGPIPGTLEVRYTNQEIVPLEEVYFRLFSYVYGGEQIVENVLVDGEMAETTAENANTALRVDLPQPLEVGESVVISMDFTLILPFSMEGSYGLLGYFGRTLTLDTFYPMIPAYDEDYGWYTHIPYPNGDLTYNDASYYRVTVRAPEDFVLATSGQETESTTTGGIQTSTFAAGPARDFYIAGSYDFTVVSDEVNGVTVNSYAKAGQEIGQEIALNAAVDSIRIYSQFFGAYPYTEFDIVNAPMLAYGIEYPGITNIFDSLYYYAENETGLTTLEFVVAHEVGHQWFYNVVGNDQQEQPWLDESVTQYITYLYMDTQHGEAASKYNIADWQLRLSGVEDAEMSIGMPSKAYDSMEYSGIVYGRGPLFFLELEDLYGQSVVTSALQAYYQENLWGHGEEDELRTSLETACTCDLTEMFEEWIYP